LTLQVTFQSSVKTTVNNFCNQAVLQVPTFQQLPNVLFPLAVLLVASVSLSSVNSLNKHSWLGNSVNQSP